MIKKIWDLVRYCKSRQYGSTRPKRFRFSPKDAFTAEFNSVIEVYVMKLSDDYALHVFCTGTLLQQGCLLRNITAHEA